MSFIGSYLSSEIVLLLLHITLSNSCSYYNTCESCAGAAFGSAQCRWCLPTAACVASKYRCDPRRTVLHSVNCPLDLSETSFYNDSFNRNVIAYYLQAANRVHNTDTVGAVDSCLELTQSNYTKLYEFNAVTRNVDQVAAVVVADHTHNKLIIAFRSTNTIVQFFTQGFFMVLGMMEDFKLGGRMLSYYNRAYNDMLSQGFEAVLADSLQRFPSYEPVTAGHSLGGTLATIFSLHIAVTYNRDVIEYAWSGPRAGDEQFAALHHRYVKKAFRIIRDGDWVPDTPFRISQILPNAHHTAYEVFYGSHMAASNYHICPQAETEECNKGSWWRFPAISHIFLFDQNYINYLLGNCTRKEISPD